MNDKQIKALTKTDCKIEEMDKMLEQHELNFINDELEPKDMTDEEMDKLGYYQKYGMLFDADD
jgi:hypothetical protein